MSDETITHFPDDLGCWIWDGFKNTAMQPKRYLGEKKKEDRHGLITATFLMERDVDAKALFDWWVLQADYGNKFIINDPHFFSKSGIKKVRMINDLTITETGDDSYKAIFNLQIMRSDGMLGFI